MTNSRRVVADAIDFLAVRNKVSDLTVAFVIYEFHILTITNTNSSYVNCHAIRTLQLSKFGRTGLILVLIGNL